MSILMLVIVLVLVAPSIVGTQPDGTARPASSLATPTGRVPLGSVHGIPPLTEDEPIEMPNFLGQPLEYAQLIWEEDDEEFIPIIVKQPDNADPAHLIVVKQEPAPGVIILPEDTQVVLTLGFGPLVLPPPSPTPLPRRQSLAAPLDTATLLRSPYVQDLKTTALTLVWT
ncbi:MAG: PASTA domain-containing protein, partial [Anaerolineales bacterium]